MAFQRYSPEEIGVLCKAQLLLFHVPSSSASRKRRAATGGQLALFEQQHPRAPAGSSGKYRGGEFVPQTFGGGPAKPLPRKKVQASPAVTPEGEPGGLFAAPKYEKTDQIPPLLEGHLFFDDSNMLGWNYQEGMGEYTHNQFYVKIPYNKSDVEKIKQIPGRIWDQEEKIWIIPSTVSAIESILTQFRKIRVGQSLAYSYSQYRGKGDKIPLGVRPVSLRNTPWDISR